MKEIYVVYGFYDILAKIRAETMNKLKIIVPLHILRIKKVRFFPNHGSYKNFYAESKVR